MASLDFAAAITVAQLVSGELEPVQLLRTIVQAAATHIGAQRVVLALVGNDDLRVAAECLVRGDCSHIDLSSRAIADARLPVAALRHAARSSQVVNLDDATHGDLFPTDPERSVLCLPMLVGAVVTGVLYLERASGSGAFTPERIQLARLLVSQSATALQNARRHAALKEENAAHRRAEAERDRDEHLGPEERFRELADALPEVIWITELDPERVVYCSPSFERIWGYTVAELYAQPRLWTDTIHPEDRARVAEKFARWIHGVEAKYDDVEFRIVRPDGHIRWIRDIGVVSKNRHGVPYRVGGIATDITSQKLADEAQHQARAELAHLNRVATMAELTASIAHEVSQPLSAIVTSAGAGTRWLRATPPDVEQTRETLARIARDGGRATDVITRLRTLFPQPDPERAVFLISEVVGEVESFVCSDLRRRRIALEVDESCAAFSTWGSRVQIQQVLLNLVLNAVDAIEAGAGADPVICIAASLAEGGLVEITVRDTGIGLDEATAAHIFDAFYTTKTGGMGVGLSVARSIVEAHDGRIGARANEGRGATFSFGLPIAARRPASG